MRTSLMAMLVAAGCASDPRLEETPGSAATSGSPPTGAETGAPQGGTTTSADPSGPDASTSDDETTDGAKFDLPGGGPTPGVGCEKVDFLFIVDNSGSMEDEQQQLVASFPQFMETIRDEIAAQDFHLMVVSTDGEMSMSSGSGGSQVVTCTAGNCTCSPAPDCCADACEIGDTCFGVPCGVEVEIDACDVELGSGRRVSAGNDCGLDDGVRYVTDADMDLEQRFLCLADVGTFGSGNEIPMEAMLAATGSEQTSGGCNDGFLRDDAVLVVTIITDEEDDPDGFFGSEGDPAQWRQDLLARKGGNETGVVVLSLIGDNDQPGGICADLDEDGVNGAEASPRLRTFAESFGSRGFVGSVCADNYDTFFEQAVSVVDTACETFEPEG